MRRPSSFIVPASVGLALCLAASPVHAQLTEVREKRFELVPFAGYQWGGSFDTRGNGGSVPAGTLRLKDSFSWGLVLSTLARLGTAIELTYLRQDSDIEFDPATGATRDLGGFAVNYIQIGGRQEFGRGGQLRPFLGGSIGLGIMDPKEGNLDSSTRFSWSVGGGAKYMFANERTGIRADAKLWATPVPSGEIGIWCGFYSCVAAEGTEWVTQGQVSGGIVVAF
jgi:opacity protein-like surface antigen